MRGTGCCRVYLIGPSCVVATPVFTLDCGKLLLTGSISSEMSAAVMLGLGMSGLAAWCRSRPRRRLKQGKHDFFVRGLPLLVQVSFFISLLIQAVQHVTWPGLFNHNQLLDSHGVWRRRLTILLLVCGAWRHESHLELATDHLPPL